MKRIIIEAEKCDGCKSCSLACMQAHRKDSGDIYTLDLNDINNESRNFIYKQPDGSYRPIFCRHCDEPECVISCMSGALTKNPEDGHCLLYTSRAAEASCHRRNVGEKTSCSRNRFCSDRIP